MDEFWFGLYVVLWIEQGGVNMENGDYAGIEVSRRGPRTYSYVLETTLTCVMFLHRYLGMVESCRGRLKA